MKPVFLHYDQRSLDCAYDQRIWADDQDGVIARLAARGTEARARLRHITQRYGEGENEFLDISRPDPGRRCTSICMAAPGGPSDGMTPPFLQHRLSPQA